MDNQTTGENPQIKNRNWDVLCHLAALAGFIGIPLGNVIGPLVVWLIKKDEIPSVNQHGRESLNFQISMTIYTIIAAFSFFIAIGIILLPAILLTNLILLIIAAVKANKGEFYRYPLTIRFIS